MAMGNLPWRPNEIDFFSMSWAAIKELKKISVTLANLEI